MWLHYSGQPHKVLNPLHIKRLKEDGAVEIADPSAQESLEAPEQITEPLGSSDGSTEQESQDEAPIGNPGESVEANSKKPKRSKA